MTKRFSTYMHIAEHARLGVLKDAIKNDFSYHLQEQKFKSRKQLEDEGNFRQDSAGSASAGLEATEAEGARKKEFYAQCAADGNDKATCVKQYKQQANRTNQALDQAQPKQKLSRQGTISALKDRGDQLRRRNAKASSDQIGGHDTQVQAALNDIDMLNPDSLEKELEPQNNAEVQQKLGQAQQQAPQQQAPQQQAPEPETPTPPPEQPPPEQPTEPPEPPPDGGGSKRGMGSLLKRIATKPFRAANSAVNFAAHGNINPNQSKQERLAQIENLAKQAGVSLSPSSASVAPASGAGTSVGKTEFKSGAGTQEPEGPVSAPTSGAGKPNNDTIVPFEDPNKTEKKLDAAWNAIDGDVFNEGPKIDGYKRQFKNAGRQAWNAVKSAPGQAKDAVVDAGKQAVQATKDAYHGSKNYVQNVNYNLSQDIPGTLGRGVDNVKSGVTAAADATHKGLDAASKGAAAVGRGAQAVGSWTGKFDKAASRFAQKMGGTSAPADVSGFVAGTPNEQPVNMAGPSWFPTDDYKSLVNGIAADPVAIQNDQKYINFTQQASKAEIQALLLAAQGVTNNSKT